MSVRLVLLNDVLARRDFNALVRNGLNDADAWHEQADAFRFIAAHVTQYSEMPSVESVIRAVPTFETTDVTESTETLVAKVHENNVKIAERHILEQAAKMFTTSDAYTIQRFLETELDKVRQDVNARTGVGAANWTRNVEDRIARYEERESGDDHTTIPLFFPEIDEAVGGFRYGDYVLIEAAMKVGKTTLSRIAGRNANAAGFKVLHLVAEGSKEETLAGLDTIETNVSNRGIISGTLDDEAKGVYKRRLIEFATENRPDYIVKDETDWPNGLTVEQIEADIDQYSPDVVIADQFNLFEHGGNEPRHYARTSRRLRSLLVRKRVLGVILTQSNGEYVKRRDRAAEELEDGEVRELRPPKRGDYSDTIACRQDCTKMIALDADNRFHKARVVVEISRTGGEGTSVDLSWFPDAGIVKPRGPIDDF